MRGIEGSDWLGMMVTLHRRMVQSHMYYYYTNPQRYINPKSFRPSQFRLLALFSGFGYRPWIGISFPTTGKVRQFKFPLWGVPSLTINPPLQVNRIRYFLLVNAVSTTVKGAAKINNIYIVTIMT